MPKEWSLDALKTYLNHLNRLIEFHQGEIDSIRAEIKALEKRLSNT